MVNKYILSDKYSYTQYIYKFNRKEAYLNYEFLKLFLKPLRAFSKTCVNVNLDGSSPYYISNFKQ